MADIRISGNADLADTLGFVLRKLRWDGEEALSRLIGDIAAHRSVGIVRNVAGWHRQSAQNCREPFRVPERRTAVLVKLTALEDLASARDSAGLRDDLARLDKRLRKLEPAG
jgi:ubiquinone biosynthesis protein UbiJ